MSKTTAVSIVRRHHDRLSKVEKYYGTDYSCEALADDLIQSWEACGRREDLRLPEPNRVIATVNTPTEEPGRHCG